MDDNQRIMQDKNAQCKVVSGVAERSNSGKTKVQENVDYNVCWEESDETDLFKQHFGSLSTTHKVGTLACVGIYKNLRAVCLNP